MKIISVLTLLIVLQGCAIAVGALAGGIGGEAARETADKK